MSKFFISAVFLLHISFAFANVTDSLLSLISEAESDTQKINYNLQIAQFYHNNKADDSAKIYINESLKLADKIFKKENDSITLLYLYEYYDVVTVFFYSKSDFKRSLELYKISLKIAKRLQDKEKQASMNYAIGNIYKFSSDYETALDYYQKALKLRKELKDSSGIAYSHIGIGNVFINWGDDKKAIEHYKICNDIASRIKDSIGMAHSYVGLGNCLKNIEEIEKANNNYKKAMKIYKAINNKHGVALALLNMGTNYANTEQYDKALEVNFEALKYVKEMQLKERICLIYNQIGSIYSIKEDFDKSIEYFDKSLTVAREINYRKIVLANYLSLSETYASTEDFKKALEYKNLYINLKDSVFNEEKHQQIAELETKYETAKKEQKIKIQEQKIEKDRIQKYAFMAGGVLLFIVLILIFRSYRIKRKSNIRLKEKNHQIENQKAEIEAQRDNIEQKNEELNQLVEEVTAQRDEIEAQRDKVIEQKIIIENIHKEISQSIDYAKRLQSSILPAPDIINNYFEDHMIVFKPKDKVSGDFYWWTHIENHTIVTAADCTGHGVPGAFMSMLGISFLREIVQKEYITHPGVILRKLRKEIIKSLKQKGTSGEQKDGMDMALISIDHENKKLHFAGANNPLYLIKKKNLKNSDEDISFQEIKGDKMPIAIYEKMDKYISHEIDLSELDSLYMFSDGYADQFGGPKNKKFKYKPFKKLIYNNSNKPMNEQKSILEKTYSDWKGNNEQLDDVLVIGLKIKNE